MKVVLVNTNTYTYPPTIPVGMEYLIAPLERAGFEVACLDLTFSSCPEKEAYGFVQENRPDAVCFSIRNIDTAIFTGNQFLLEKSAAVIKTIKDSFGIPTIAGGSATLCAGKEIARYTGADTLIRGPGEGALPILLKQIEQGIAPESPVDGWAYGIIPDIVHRRGEHLDYSPYLSSGHPAGIEFRKGCDWSCPFCVERLRPIFSRTVEATLKEIESLVSTGTRSIFFCDSELNIDTENTSRLLEMVKNEKFELEMSGYFRPVPMDPQMMKLMRESGFNKITLSVNSWDLSAESSPYTGKDVQRFIRLAKEEGISIAVDLLVGYPGEDADSVKTAIETVGNARPDTVGINPYIRLYDQTPAVEDALESARGKKGRIIGNLEENPEILKPVFYLGIDISWLEKVIESESTFVLEGSSKTVNYERI